jgi:hypothetical protein
MTLEDVARCFRLAAGFAQEGFVDIADSYAEAARRGLAEHRPRPRPGARLRLVSRPEPLRDVIARVVEDLKPKGGEG